MLVRGQERTVAALGGRVDSSHSDKTICKKRVCMCVCVCVRVGGFDYVNTYVCLSSRHRAGYEHRRHGWEEGGGKKDCALYPGTI